MPYLIKKDFDISKKHHNMQAWRYASKTAYISWTMDSSWFIHESLAQKPDWWADSKLCSLQYSKRELNISLLNIFPQLAAEKLVSSYWLLVCHLCYEWSTYSISSHYLEKYIIRRGYLSPPPFSNNPSL